MVGEVGKAWATAYDDAMKSETRRGPLDAKTDLVEARVSRGTEAAKRTPRQLRRRTNQKLWFPFRPGAIPRDVSLIIVPCGGATGLAGRRRMHPSWQLTASPTSQRSLDGFLQRLLGAPPPAPALATSSSLPT